MAETPNVEILTTDCKKHGRQPVFVTIFPDQKIKVSGCYQCILEWKPSEESRGSTE